MKLIYLANARIPTEKAHGLQIMKMCEAFEKGGSDVELVVAKRKDNQMGKINPFDYYGLTERFLIKKLPLIDLVDRGRSIRGLSVLIQNTSFAISAFFYLVFKKVDIIYSRDEFSLLFLSFFKDNLVLELHNFPKRKKWLYKFIFKRVKKIIVITNQLKKLVVELGIEEGKIKVSPDGVDLEKFELSESKGECRRKLNLPEEKNIILYAGHLFAWKGIYTLAEASKFLAANDLVVVVGGMDYDRNKFFKFITENNLKNVLLIGHRPPTEIPYYLKAADVLVLPNSGHQKISKFYTSPMKLFEYMAAKRPIVASNLPSIREILSSREAVLFMPDDPKSLAEGVSTILSNKQLAQTLADNGYKKSKKYTWDERIKSILGFVGF